MTQVIVTIRPTTELQAANAMLAALGEAQLAASTDLSTSTQADMELALNILLDTAREVQAMGWRFNTEEGVAIAPIATYNWVDTAGVTTSLNIFKRPADALAWKQSQCRENQGIDLVERPSKGYTETALSVPVLYDRMKNRDGAEAARYPYVYLDTVSAFDFQQLPETCRWFITVRAARKLVQQALGSETLRGFTAQDEMSALRSLKRDQGNAVDLNMLQTAGAQDILGRRQQSFGGFSTKVYPGKA